MKFCHCQKKNLIKLAFHVLFPRKYAKKKSAIYFVGTVRVKNQMSISMKSVAEGKVKIALRETMRLTIQLNITKL